MSKTTSIQRVLGLQSVTPIRRGMADDQKYAVIDAQGRALLLRLASVDTLARRQAEYDAMRRLDTLNVPMSRPVAFGVCELGVYTLSTWCTGRTLDTVLQTADKGEQYQLGQAAGRILCLIHQLDAEMPSNQWAHRYLQVIQPRFDAYQQLAEPFPGCQRLYDDAQERLPQLNGRPQCHHHGDYHTGNLIMEPSGALSVIDWHFVDFDNHGDPWYEFNRIAYKRPDYAAGQIDGYFDGNVPNAFWPLLRLYLSTSALTSIAWAQYSAPECLPDILLLNQRVLHWYQHGTRDLPSWYTSVHRT